MPSSIVGLDPYAELYADSKLWLENGWVDVLAPQLYWRIDPPAQSYTTCIDWWINVNPERFENWRTVSVQTFTFTSHTFYSYLYAANALYRLPDGWPNSEIINQVGISRAPARRAKGSLGNIHFNAAYIRDNYHGIADSLRFVCHNLVCCEAINETFLCVPEESALAKYPCHPIHGWAERLRSLSTG